MILAYKYMDLKTCVLNVAAIIIESLQVNPSLSLSNLDEIVQTILGEDARFNFFPALNLLYLLGKLNYEEDLDAVILTKKNEANT